EPAVRNPRRRPAGDRGCGARERDGAARRPRRLRRGRAAGRPVRAGKGDPCRSRRRVRPRRDGSPRPCVRRDRGEPADRGRTIRPGAPRAPGEPVILEVLFWAALGALAWTHVGYPAAAALAARLRERPVRGSPSTPPVTVIVAAWNEESVIERRLENLLALDY